MNKLLIILGIVVLLICVGLSGCQEVTNSYPEEDIDIEKMILGSWKWVETTVMVNGKTNSTNNTGHEWIYTFYDNGSMKWESNFNFSFQEFYPKWGNYRIENNKLIGSPYGFPYSSTDINISEDGKYLTLIGYGVYPDGKTEKSIVRCVKLE